MKPATRQLIEIALANDETVNSAVAEAIGDALRGQPQQASAVVGPLLLSMTDAANLLGVSRVTLWRMVRIGVLKPVEIMPGVRRVRRQDLHRISANYATHHPTPRGEAPRTMAGRTAGTG